METMFMQNFRRTNKEYYGIFESGLYLETSPNAYGLFLILTELSDLISYSRL